MRMKIVFISLLLLLSLFPILSFAQAKEGEECKLLSGLTYSTSCDCGQTCIPRPTATDSNRHECWTTGDGNWYNPCKAKLESQWSLWGPIAMSGVLVAFLVSALAYMIGIGFDLRELRMWAKSELYQAFASAVLVGGLIALSYVMLDEGMAVILGQGANPFNIGFNYLESIARPMIDAARTVYTANFYVEAVSTFYSYQNMGGGQHNFLLFLKPLISDPLHLALHFIIQVLIVVYFQEAMLSFFQQKMFSVLLPLGVFLRTFPVTRGAGGLIIAIAIGFFFVYPTMFAFVARMAEGGASMEEALALAKASTVGIDFSQYSACEHDFESAAKVGEEQASPAVIAKVNQFHSFIPPILLKAIFYPMIIMAVTISFIRIMAPLLGSDISEIGQGLIKLI